MQHACKIHARYMYTVLVPAGTYGDSVVLTCTAGLTCTDGAHYCS